MTDRLKVGVVGAGVIAQVMHLNYLRELSDRFEIVALCDISDENADQQRRQVRHSEEVHRLAGDARRTPTSTPSSS